jgi:hypothetical protein
VALDRKKLDRLAVFNQVEMRLNHWSGSQEIASGDNASGAKGIGEENKSAKRDSPDSRWQR